MISSSLLSGLAVSVLAVAVFASASRAEEGLSAIAGEDSPLQDGERIVFFGDSITQAGTSEQGYITRIQQAIDEGSAERDVRLINAGISGHKVPDLQARLERDVLAKQPTAVWIYIGINDVWHSERGEGTPRDAYRDGLREIIKRIRDEAGATVVLATPSVIGEKTDGSNPLDDLLEEYADISREVAEELDVPLCDLREAFLAHLREHNKDEAEAGILTTDGVHLNPAGDALVADHAAAALAEALADR